MGMRGGWVGFCACLAVLCSSSACNLIHGRGVCHYSSRGSNKPMCGEMQKDRCMSFYRGTFSAGGTKDDCVDEGYTKCNGKIACEQP